MVKQKVPQSEDLDLIFHALSDATRRAMVGRLAAGPATVTELARPFPMSLAAVSKHLSILERASVIARTKRGRERICSLNPGRLDDAYQWLTFHRQFWEQSLDALEDFLNDETKK